MVKKYRRQIKNNRLKTFWGDFFIGVMIILVLIPLLQATIFVTKTTPIFNSYNYNYWTFDEGSGTLAKRLAASELPKTFSDNVPR